MAEGNHRLAAAERYGLETVKVQRGATYEEQMRGSGIPSTASRRGPRTGTPETRPAIARAATVMLGGKLK
jgi:hypothetical protein